MGKIAFVFSGQGDQHAGMGKELALEYKLASDIFDTCDRLRPETSRQCFEGTEEELRETKNTQPCLFAMELAAATVLRERGIVPDAVAGFSLGEVSASVFVGLFDLETGFRLVCKRGELMGEAAEKVEASMAAVLRLTPEKVSELASKYENVFPVNFNCPGQISVSGLTSEMTKFFTDVKAAGGSVIPLKVKGGFHSPFMKEASAAFEKELMGAKFHTPAITLYSNVTAMPYDENYREQLAKQIASPVRWEETIRNIIASGCDTFIEIGPGKTLTNMIGKIDANVKTYAVCDLPKILAEVKPC